MLQNACARPELCDGALLDSKQGGSRQAIPAQHARAVAAPLRLYWGFVGNLRESPPAIVAFLIVTFFPCTPVCLYLLFDQRAIEPIDKAVSTATICFLAAEICAGIFAMYSIVRTQSEQFLVQEARLRAEGRL